MGDFLRPGYCVPAGMLGGLSSSHRSAARSPGWAVDHLRSSGLSAGFFEYFNFLKVSGLSRVTALAISFRSPISFSRCLQSFILGGELRPAARVFFSKLMDLYPVLPWICEHHGPDDRSRLDGSRLGLEDQVSDEGEEK